MVDAYLIDVLPIKGQEKYKATIDFADGTSYASICYTDKELAQKDLDEKVKELNVKKVPDPRMTSPALSKEEREFISEAKKKNKKYKDLLLQSRIERRKLTEEEMDVGKLEDKIKDKEVELKEMK